MLAAFESTALNILSQVVYYAVLVVGLLVYRLLRVIYARLTYHAPTTKSLEMSHNKDIEINIQLDRVLRKFDCQRAYLSLFHNGDHFIDGSEILKKSRTHERVRRGVAFQSGEFQNVLITTMPEEVRLVLDDGPSYTKVADLPDGKLRWLCDQGGVTAVARIEVRCGPNRVGFLGIDFDCVNCEKPENINDLANYARQIGQILTDYSNPNKPPPERKQKFLPRLFDQNFDGAEAENAVMAMA